MKKNYIIPYGERHTKIGGFGYKRTLMCVDNLGLVVEHPNEMIPTDDDVRGHLIGWNAQHRIFIQADSLQDALKEFYDYPECKIGTKHRAWELVDSESNPVIEYVACEHMRLLKNGSTACACWDEPNEGEGWEMCVIDGRDEPPSECPIHAQKQGNRWRKEVIQVGGIWIKRYSRFVRKMDEQINAIMPRRL